MKSLFVCGTGRSGTTIFSKMLNEHSNVLNMGETHLFHDYDKLVGLVRRRLIKGVVNGGNKEFAEEMNKYLIDYAMRNSISIFINNIMNQIFDIYGIKILMDKTPHNLIQSQLIEDVYPNPVFIHVVRNPLDVFASMKQHTSWGHSTLSEFVFWYSNFMHRSLSQWMKLECPKMVVCFEYLAKHDRNVFVNVCELLDIDSFFINGFDKNKAHVGRHEFDLSKREISFITDKCIKFYYKWLELQ